MKATQRDFARRAPRAVQEAGTFFLCGPDEAGASQAAATLIGLLPDAGERVDISGADLRKDPVRLGDEARSISMFGDKRHIVVRASGDEAYDAVANHLTGAGQAWPVFIIASGATDASRTAKLLAPRPDALVGMFYVPDENAFAHDLRARGAAMGLRFGADIATRLARASGRDMRLALSELTKFAAYLDAAPERPCDLTAAALDAVGAVHEDDGFAAVVDAALGGKRAALAGELRRMRELGLSPVGLLLACQRRAATLARLAGKLGPRGSISALVESEKAARRIWGGEAAAVSDQLARWQGARAARLVARLVALHREILTNSQDGELLLAQGLTAIAREAARARR